MKARQALERILATMGAYDRRHDEKPGHLVSRSGAESRAALEHLTSAEAANVRDDVMRWFVSKPGFCSHGMKFTEQCASCKRTWRRP